MMRKFVTLLLCALLLSGCKAVNNPDKMQTVPSIQNQPAPQPTQCERDDLEIGQHLLGSSVSFKAQYIRTDGFYYYADTGYPQVVVIDSKETAREYYLSIVPHDFDNVEPTVSTGALKPLVGEEYTEDFFINNYLIYLILEEPSGSISHTVESVRLSQDKRLLIAVSRNVPEVGTDDMAYWHIVLELPRKDGVADAENIDVFFDGVLAYDGAPVIPEVEQPIYVDPPEAKLIYPDGSVSLKPGSFSWKVLVDGQEQILCADAPHPLQCKDLLKPIVMSGEYVKLDFPDFSLQPDSVNVCCWQDTAWGLTDTPPDVLSVYGTAFDVKSGGYIYQITVTFSEYGTVEYYAYIKNYVSGIS